MNSQRHHRSVILPTDSHPVVLYSNGTVTCRSSLAGVAVFPGSFDPLHSGHLRLAEVAANRLGMQVVFELSVSNVEKNPLKESQLHRRLSQFQNHSVAVTNASRFLEKSQLFKGCPFVVGFDTAVRILQPRFYNNNDQHLREALRQFQLSRHQFVVGGRLADANGAIRFCGQEELSIPAGFHNLFDVLHEAEFRADISSSEIRAGLIEDSNQNSSE